MPDESPVSEVWNDVFTDPVQITSGKSCSAKMNGLRINRNETLASWFSKTYPSPVEINLHAAKSGFPDTIKVKACGRNAFEMSFMRTVRVPDNGKTYKLPPGLGRFPLFNVEAFSSRLPPEIAKKGGIFFPIYRMLAFLSPSPHSNGR
jgi:hypothetical protein